MIRKAEEIRETAARPRVRERKAAKRKPTPKRRVSAAPGEGLASGRGEPAADRAPASKPGAPGEPRGGDSTLLADLEAKLREALAQDDARDVQGCLQDASSYISERLCHHLRAHHLAFDPDDLMADLLARLMLDRTSFSGDFEEWVEGAAKVVVAERHRRVSRLLAREVKALNVQGACGAAGGEEKPGGPRRTAEAAMGRGARRTSGGEYGDAFGGTALGYPQDAPGDAPGDALLGGGSLEPNVLAEALAVLPEGHRRCLEQIVMGRLRYVDLAEHLSLPESAVPSKIRRIRERMVELVQHLTSREQLTSRINRQIRGVSDGLSVVSSSRH